MGHEFEHTCFVTHFHTRDPWVTKGSHSVTLS